MLINPILVRQEEHNGCVCASLAMILGITYDEAKQRFPYGADKDGYYSSGTLQIILRNLKWKFEFKTKNKIIDGIWPPLPFAPIHKATVLINENAPCFHSVIMREDGAVLDPLSDDLKRLSDYYSVYSVMGLYPPQDK